MDRPRISRLLAAVVDLTELVDDPLGHRRTDAAATERMRHDQRFLFEYRRQAFPRRQRRVRSSPGLAPLLPHFLDLNKNSVICGPLVPPPVEVRAHALP